MRWLIRVVIVLWVNSTVPAQTLDSPIELDYGDYSVGFRRVAMSDPSRQYSEPGPAESPVSIERPMRLAYWYPAEEDGEQLLFRDYVRFGKERGADDTAVVRGFAQSVERGDPELVQALLEGETYAHLDATAAEGRFPLILYAPSFNADNYENSVLCEYLASHGFFVAACPSIGAEDRLMTADLAGLEAQVEDLAFLLAAVEKEPSVDASRIGIAGYSWGGCSDVMFALREPRIVAVVALDGSIGYSSGLDALKPSTDFEPGELTAAFLQLAMGDRFIPASVELDLGVVRAATEVPRAVGRLTHLHHGDFASTTIARTTQCQKLPGRDGAAGVYESYRTICRYTMNFFDAFVREDELAREFLELDPLEVEVSEGVLEYRFFATGDAPPQQPAGG